MRGYMTCITMPSLIAIAKDTLQLINCISRCEHTYVKETVNCTCAPRWEQPMNFKFTDVGHAHQHGITTACQSKKARERNNDWLGHYLHGQIRFMGLQRESKYLINNKLLLCTPV